MPTLELTDQQVMDLAKQLPATQQAALFNTLITHLWGEWKDLSRLGEERMRIVAAERGHNWDTMTEDEREAFVDFLVHEDRACGG